MRMGRMKTRMRMRRTRNERLGEPLTINLGVLNAHAICWLGPPALMIFGLISFSPPLYLNGHAEKWMH